MAGAGRELGTTGLRARCTDHSSSLLTYCTITITITIVCHTEVFTTWNPFCTPLPCWTHFKFVRACTCIYSNNGWLLKGCKNPDLNYLAMFWFTTTILRMSCHHIAVLLQHYFIEVATLFQHWCPKNCHCKSLCVTLPLVEWNLNTCHSFCLRLYFIFNWY